MVTVLGVGGGARLGAMVLLVASGRGPKFKLSLTRTVGLTVGVGPAVTSNLQDDSLTRSGVRAAGPGGGAGVHCGYRPPSQPASASDPEVR